ncbi:hypothetical protein RFI_22813, partial [Reticulomyxa filosa]
KLYVCSCGVFWNLCMELFWFERLKLAYQNTPYFINVYIKYGVYIICIVVTTWVMTFALIITIQGRCGQTLDPIDFNPFGENYSIYNCGGGCGIFILSSLLAYMYLSRLLRMANEHKHEGHFDATVYKAIQRATIIAVTSTCSNLIAVVVAVALVGTLEAGTSHFYFINLCSRHNSAFITLCLVIVVSCTKIYLAAVVKCVLFQEYVQLLKVKKCLLRHSPRNNNLSMKIKLYKRGFIVDMCSWNALLVLRKTDTNIIHVICFAFKIIFMCGKYHKKEKSYSKPFDYVKIYKSF